MVAIHSRFRSAMLERLNRRLGTVQGNTALLCQDPSVASELSYESDSITVLDGLDERRWDSLICVAQLWQVRDLQRVSDSLAADGRLFFVEPAASFGLAGNVQSLGAKVIKARLGMDFGTDVPEALRKVGLTPTSTDRFRCGSPVFTFVAGEARRY